MDGRSTAVAHGGEHTLSLKVKLSVVIERYHELIDSLYR
jgi:hypothetical protein